ncbi:MAG: DUF3656 domain-containing protein [Christensenella sp.]|nr:MAG: DUF3656 domain-containing protein [Christensenella sp.]
MSEQRYVPIDISVVAKAGKPLEMTASATTRNGVVSVTKAAATLEKAQNAPTDANDISASCSKTADSGFSVRECVVDTDGVFAPKSVINALRRDVLCALKEEIINANSPKKVGINQEKIDEYLAMKFENVKAERLFVARENEYGDFAKKGEKTAIYPSVYSATAVKRMLDEYDLDESEVALGLPIIANGKDIAAIEKLLADMPKIKTLVSHNVYGLYFAKKGYEIVAGQGHNIANGYAVLAAEQLGAHAYEPSLEYRDFATHDTIKRYAPSKDIALMTFAHCPYKTIYGNDCKNCRYKGDISVSREKRSYVIKRTRVAGCYFGLYPACD